MRDPKNLSGTKVPPTNVNMEFAMEIARVMGPLERIMVGKRHLCEFDHSRLPPLALSHHVSRPRDKKY